MCDGGGGGNTPIPSILSILLDLMSNMEDANGSSDDADTLSELITLDGALGNTLKHTESQERRSQPFFFWTAQNMVL